MSSDLESSIQLSRKKLTFLRDQSPSFREAIRPVAGDKRIREADFLERDELIVQEEMRLADYEDMLRRLFLA
jgi:hypothetical protein